MKRKFFVSAGFAGLATSLLASCTSTTSETTQIKTDNLTNGNIIHQVYFWLKADITAKEEKDFLEFFKILKTVPGIKTLYVGKPAPTNPRPVVDNSFSYSITVIHENMAAINLYETHPIHLEAIEKFKKYWVKVEVRDSDVIDV